MNVTIINSSIKLKPLCVAVCTCLAIAQAQSAMASTLNDNKSQSIDLKAFNEIVIPTSCQGADCKLYEANTALDNYVRVHFGQGLNLKGWSMNQQYQPSTVENKTMIVKGMAQDVKAIYWVSSNSSTRWIDFITANNNTLVLASDNKDRDTFTLGGVANNTQGNGDRQGIPAIATVGLISGEANKNNLYIKNLNLNLTKDENSSIYTAFIARPGYTDNDPQVNKKVKVSGNKLVIDNVVLKSAKDDTLHNTHLGAAFVNTTATSLGNGATYLDFETKDNKVFIKDSDLDVGVIAASHSDIGSTKGGNYATNNSVFIDNSKIEFGRLKTDASSSGGIWASIFANSAFNNNVEINNSSLTIDRAHFTKEGDRITISAAYGATTKADKNRLIFKNVTIKEASSGSNGKRVNIVAGGSNLICQMLDQMILEQQMKIQLK